MTAKELLVEAMRRNDAHDLEGFLAMQSEDCTWTVPGAELHGRDAMRGWVRPFHEAFSQSRHDLQRFVEDGHTVCTEGVWSGVHDGTMATPQGDLPATGRAVSLRFACVLTGDLEAGLARSVRIYFDQLEFLGQLGLLPEPEAEAARA